MPIEKLTPLSTDQSKNGLIGLLFILCLSLSACSGGGNKSIEGKLAPTNVTTIGINSYLWRASLDVIAFMPLLQTDSEGGVILTDWYVNPVNSKERMKLTISILDQDLRADALHVAAARQVMQNNGWVSAPVRASTEQKIESAILSQARYLRQRTLSN